MFVIIRLEIQLYFFFRVLKFLKCCRIITKKDFSAKVSSKTSAISASEVTTSSPTFKCPTLNEEFLPLTFWIMSHVFFTDDLEFNLDTYCRQDARLLCLIVRRTFARAILNFARFSWVGLRLNCPRKNFRSASCNHH